MLSGLTLAELRDGSKRAEKLAAEAEKLGAKKRAVAIPVIRLRRCGECCWRWPMICAWFC